MFTNVELKKIITQALKRRGTAIKRLHKAQVAGDVLRCDELIGDISFINDLIANAEHDLKRRGMILPESKAEYLAGVNKLHDELFGETV